MTATSGGFTNSYSYNAAGDQTNRTLSGTSNTLAYDYEGQLTSITVGGATTSFAYDALGRRITRTAGGTTKQFLSSGSQVWLESVGSTVTATYTHGNGLIRKDGEYFQVDGLGSARGRSPTVCSPARRAFARRSYNERLTPQRIPADHDSAIGGAWLNRAQDLVPNGSSDNQSCAPP